MKNQYLNGMKKYSSVLLIRCINCPSSVSSEAKAVCFLQFLHPASTKILHLVHLIFEGETDTNHRKTHEILEHNVTDGADADRKVEKEKNTSNESRLKER